MKNICLVLAAMIGMNMTSAVFANECEKECTAQGTCQAKKVIAPEAADEEVVAAEEQATEEKA